MRRSNTSIATSIPPLDLATHARHAFRLQTFETEAARAADSASLLAAMKKRYPDVAGVSTLESSAKVIKGEMKWPVK
jgi:hypothetical protein